MKIYNEVYYEPNVETNSRLHFSLWGILDRATSLSVQRLINTTQVNIYHPHPILGFVNSSVISYFNGLKQ